MTTELSTQIATHKIIIREKGEPPRVVYAFDHEADEITKQKADWQCKSVQFRRDEYAKDEIFVKKLSQKDQQEYLQRSACAARLQNFEDQQRRVSAQRYSQFQQVATWREEHPAEWEAVMREVNHGMPEAEIIGHRAHHAVAISRATNIVITRFLQQKPVV